MDEAYDKGIGKAGRRRMIRRWKAEGNGLSLKAWARRQSSVGDAAYVWVQAKRKRGKP
jgi:hypothetical protein